MTMKKDDESTPDLKKGVEQAQKLAERCKGMD
jgi:hypothetical protein